MSLHLRSAAERTALLAKRNCNAQSSKAAFRQLATWHKLQPTAVSSKLEKNIVTSPHADCNLHGMSLVHRFFENASRWKNKIALECGVTGRAYTYEMTRQLIRRFSSALTRMKFQKGQVMGIVSPNIPEFPIAMLGASGAGMPVALVNPIYTPDEIARQLSAVGATTVFGVAPMVETLKQVAQLCPSIRQIILLGPPQEGCISFQQMVQDSGDLFNENLDIDINEDIFLLPHSSGTTGMPKSVMLTHANVGANVSQNLHPGSHTNHSATDTHQEIHICLLPFFHSYGVTGLLLIDFDVGAKLVTLPKFDVQSYLKAIDDHKPTLLHIVPTLAQLFINHPALKMESFERLHTIFSAAAPLGANTAVKLVEKFRHLNVVVQEGYGLSEMSPGTMLTPVDNSQLGSCGRLISRTKGKIVDLETGQNLGPNQHGELYLNGPQVMKGYWNNQKATDEMIDADGWLRTGDVAYYDEGGNFFIVDRLKDLIKVKGFQVAPAELEEILATHPAVAEAAVIGIPDQHAGELPRAYVVKKPGMESVSDAEIQSYVDAKVSAHKRIKGGIEIIDCLPKNNMGKILRKELRAQHAHIK